MTNRFQAIRGMNDILPEKTKSWRDIESIFASCAAQFGFREIRFPYLESTALFKRTIGEVTDIVEKEMYTFSDLNGEMISLRPEGTAGCVRACNEHGIIHNKQQRLWYQGAMFRHERPQKGRYRQFNQFGVEVFGIAGEGIELELIQLSKSILNKLEIEAHVVLEINTLGNLDERKVYREHLLAYFIEHKDDLDEDSKRRLDRNPLRILDSKNPQMKSIIDNAPNIVDFLSLDSRDEFQRLCAGLDSLGISYVVNPALVRGLDYYSGLVFEWVTDKLGSQATVCAGGRYDQLVEQLGGKPTPAIGFALGVERLLLVMETIGLGDKSQGFTDVYFVTNDDKSLIRALILAEKIRTSNSSYRVIVDTTGGSLKSQFKKADQSGAQFAFIIGESEYQNHEVSIKPLLGQSDQFQLRDTDIISYISTNLMV